MTNATAWIVFILLAAALTAVCTKLMPRARALRGFAYAGLLLILVDATRVLEDGAITEHWVSLVFAIVGIMLLSTGFERRTTR